MKYFYLPIILITIAVVAEVEVEALTLILLKAVEELRSQLTLRQQ